MYKRLPVVLLVCLISTLPVSADMGDHYQVPRTEHGHPDFQGIWATSFLTTLERPAGVAGGVRADDRRAVSGDLEPRGLDAAEIK